MKIFISIRDFFRDNIAALAADDHVDPTAF